MIARYSKFVYVASGAAVAAVTAWVMVGWDRGGGGHAQLGDYAYLETAHYERYAAQPVRFDAFGNVTYGFVPSGDMLFYGSWYTNIQDGSIVATMTNAWTNAVVTPVLNASFTDHLMWRIKAATNTWDFGASWAGWAAPDIWNAEATNAMQQFGYFSTYQDTYFDVGGSGTTPDGIITNWPTFYLTNSPYAHSDIYNVASNVYPLMMYRLASPNVGHVTSNYTASASYTYASGLDPTITNSVDRTLFSQAVSGAFNAGVWTNTGYNTASFPLAAVNIHVSVRETASVDARCTLTMSANWPGSAIGFAPLTVPRFVAYGGTNCIVRRAWAILESVSTMTTSGYTNETMTFAEAIPGAAEFARDVYGAPGAGSVAWYEVTTGEPYEANGASSVVRRAWSVPLTPTVAGDAQYPLWTMTLPAFRDVALYDSPFWVYGEWPRNASQYAVPDPSYISYSLSTDIEVWLYARAVLIEFDFETYDREPVWTNFVKWTDRRVEE